MSNELTDAIYAKVTKELKIRTKKQALDLRIHDRDYVTLALEHYADHIDNNEIDFDANLIDDK